MSWKDFESYAGLARRLAGRPLTLGLPTNSLKFLADAEHPAGMFLWVDPPWVLLRQGTVVVDSGSYPDPNAPTYQQEHVSWGILVREAFGDAALRDVRGRDDGTTEFHFTDELVLRCPAVASESSDLWYDQWYASS